MDEGEARLVMFKKKKSDKDSSSSESSTSKVGLLQAEAFEGTIEGPPDVSMFLEKRLTPGGSESMHQVSTKKVSLRYRGKNRKNRKNKNKNKNNENGKGKENSEKESGEDASK